MRLSDIFKSDNFINETQNISRPDSAKQAQINRQIRAMTPGQTLNGEIVAKNGGEVSIRLAEDFILNARLEQNMNLDIGKMMTFEVRNNGKALTLSPLFANTATDANVLKALDMAMLPVNETTVEMAGKMMEAGMSVDKNSIQQMYREVSAHTDAEISDIIDLHRLGLPVTEENLEQIAAYRNLEHQLIEGFHELMDGMDKALDGMLAEGRSIDAAKLVLELLEPGGDTVLSDDALQENVSGGVITENAETLSSENHAVSAKEAEYTETAKSAGYAENAGTAQLLPEEGRAERDGKVLTKTVLISEDGGESAAGPTKEKAVLSKMPSEAEEGLLKELAKNTDDLAKTQLREEFRQVLEHAVQQQDTGTVKRLLSHPDVRKLISADLQDKLALKPQEFQDKEKVESYYRKLTGQLKNLTQSLERAGQTEQPVYETAGRLSQNVDFLHQINQMFAYVQIPLKLAQGDAHGDLYVYTKKKNLAAKDGKVTALLHLDMQYLGPVDVYVAMENTKVSTNFTVKDDKMLDFLSEHMDLLTKRLSDRGYQMDFSMKVKARQEESNSGIQPILENSGNGLLLSRYAFDVRA